MKLKVSELPTSGVWELTLSGDESWLTEIAATMGQSSDAPEAKISGVVRIKPETSGFYLVSGELNHTPELPCSRCSRTTPWPLSANIQAIWRPPYSENTPKDMALSPEDLETYFIEDQCIDLGQVVLDTLHCSVPDFIRPADADDSDEIGGCTQCQGQAQNGLVYSSDPKSSSSSTSPFAKLVDPEAFFN